MNDLKKLKVGVIGLGFMGELHANVYSTLSNVELVGIADKDSEKKNWLRNTILLTMKTTMT